MFFVFSQTLSPLFWILFSGVFLTVGDVIFRFWQQYSFWNGFLLAFSFYMVGIFCLMMSFFSENIAIATIAAVVVNTVVYLLASYFFFGDTISFLECCGVILGLTAIALIELV